MCHHNKTVAKVTRKEVLSICLCEITLSQTLQDGKFDQNEGRIQTGRGQ